MKKYFNILLILLILFIFSNKKTVIPANTKDYLDFNDFKKTIQIYQSFKLENIHLYYQEYLNQNFKNYIHLLNKVNYPTFLDISDNNIYPIIKSPVILVNKKFRLENNYYPANLEIVTLDHIKRDYEMLINKTVQNNLTTLTNSLNVEFTIFSAYRSYTMQNKLFENSHDSLVAEAGTSEHQTGLAVDISLRSIGLTYELENNLLYSLLYSNSYKYGFILRYPKDKETITGFPFEPWHYRYVGKEIAEIIYKEQLTLEEYFYYYVPLKF